MEKKPLLVMNCVGLTERMISDRTPHLQSIFRKHAQHLVPPTPAVTCTSQTTLLTGQMPSSHGIVANGWYFRDLAQVWFWRQSNGLVQSDYLWDRIKTHDPSFTTANVFWWYNMYSSVDYAVTPRPLYRSDGLKKSDTYTKPHALNKALKKEFGVFPLFSFWGPKTDICSTRWIANSTVYIMEHQRPSLCLTYLPHLDYNLQRIGPNHPDIQTDLQELDVVVGQLLQTASKNGYETMIVSEYGIVPVTRPVHINRLLRQNGYITVRDECGEDHFDAGASDAFAVSDHQIAHVYINRMECLSSIKELLLQVEGIAEVLEGKERAKYQLDHERSGELICLAEPDSWFTYYYWMDDARAPDYARTVDIHRKPGYDPVELFLTPGGGRKAIWNLLKKMLGFRYRMNVIPLDADCVRGSHGLAVSDPMDGPLLLSTIPLRDKSEPMLMIHFSELIENYFLTV